MHVNTDGAVVDALAVCVAAIATAWNTRNNGFVWDDRVAVLMNKDVDSRSGRPWFKTFTNDFWGESIDRPGSHKSYRPLTTLTFRWDNYWYAYDPSAYHTTNVLVHAICSVLVWRVADIIYHKFPVKSTTPLRLRYGSLVAGLLFAVHPIHCDSVASVVGRADLLCVMFGLAGYLAYTDAERQHSIPHFVSAIVSASLACLCKELGFTVFGLYFIHDVLSALANDRPRISPIRLKRLSVLVLITLILATARVRINGTQKQAVFNELANSINHEPSRLARWLSYAHIHAWYLWKLVWPSWFSYDYGFNTIPVILSVSDPRNLLTVLAYATVAGGVYIGIRDIQRPTLLLCIAFGIIPFVPASNVFFPVGTVVAERLLYFPSVGFCLLVGIVVDHLADLLARHDSSTADTLTNPAMALNKSIFQWARRSLPWLLGCVLFTGYRMSVVRNDDWRDERSLFIAAINVVPENVKVLNNVAKVLLTTDAMKALQASRTAIAIHPVQVEGHTNLGLGYWHTRQEFLGIRHMVKSFTFTTNGFAGAGYAGSLIFNRWMEQHNHSATAEVKRRSPSVKLAIDLLEEASRRNTRYPAHYQALALVAYELKDLPSALSFLQTTNRLNERIAAVGMDTEMVLPRHKIRNFIAVVNLQLGETDTALSEFISLLNDFPTFADPYFNAAAIYVERSQIKLAEGLLDHCLRLCEDKPGIIAGAKMLEKWGSAEAATRFFQRATELSMQ